MSISAAGTSVAVIYAIDNTTSTSLPLIIASREISHPLLSFGNLLALSIKATTLFRRHLIIAFAIPGITTTISSAQIDAICLKEIHQLRETHDAILIGQHIRYLRESSVLFLKFLDEVSCIGTSLVHSLSQRSDDTLCICDSTAEILDTVIDHLVDLPGHLRGQTNLIPNGFVHNGADLLMDIIGQRLPVFLIGCVIGIECYLIPVEHVGEGKLHFILESSSRSGSNLLDILEFTSSTVVVFRTSLENGCLDLRQLLGNDTHQNSLSFTIPVHISSLILSQTKRSTSGRINTKDGAQQRHERMFIGARSLPIRSSSGEHRLQHRINLVIHSPEGTMSIPRKHRSHQRIECKSLRLDLAATKTSTHHHAHESRINHGEHIGSHSQSGIRKILLHQLLISSGVKPLTTEELLRLGSGCRTSSSRLLNFSLLLLLHPLRHLIIENQMRLVCSSLRITLELDQQPNILIDRIELLLNDAKVRLIESH